MLRLVDPYTSQPLPEGVAARVAVRQPAGGLANLVALNEATAPAAPAPLDRWDVVTHAYETSVDANVGFLANLFKGTGKVVTSGVVQEAKRYRLDKDGTGQAVEIGVAVRLSVATSKLSMTADLSVANLAAAAQLGLADTRIGIYVMGFAGPIGDIMPAPKDLNVENFANFMAAFGDIQKRVFGLDGKDFLSPTLLGYHEAPAAS